MPCLINPTFLDDFENVKAWFGRVAALPEFAEVHKQFQHFAAEMMAAKAEEEKNKPQIMKLYGFIASPPSRAVEITCKLAKVEYEFISLNLMKGEHMDKEFQALNPRHCVPTVVDGDLVLWESRAIMQYIANQYAENSSLYPVEAKTRA
ncbi:unnamed protein product [Oikopleura dioica]|uniref:GST N-terminal domain-containing protein n=1 Tax=Oikopleura dioica TaxID=34765 RepID=E4YY83_OIKDI|nr:unnamed protein product [Oikopleura dioica]